MKQNTLMLCLLNAAMAVLAAVPAWGQTAYDPKLAFTEVGGNTTNLFLANHDGSRVVRVAASPGINGIDFAPNDNRIAFTDLVGLKVLRYTPLANGIRVDSITTLVNGRFGSPDFSSDGSRLLYYQGATPSGYRAIPSAGGEPVFLHKGSPYGYGRWLQAELGNAFAFLTAVSYGPNVPVDYELWTVLLNDQDGVESAGPVLSTSNQAFKTIENFDIAHTRTAVLMQVGIPVDSASTSNIVDYDLVTGLVTAKTGLGSRPHYSGDDSKIIHKSLQTLGTHDYVLSFGVVTGVTTRIYTSKKRLGWVDAKP